MGWNSIVTLAFALISTASAAAPKGAWDAFNLAPSARVVRPVSVKEIAGTVSNGQSLVSEAGRATLSGNQTWITLDFGKEVRLGHLQQRRISCATSRSEV